MARGINSFILVGAMVREPELRYTPNGAAVLSFTVAGDSTITDSTGEVCNVAWYHRAEYISKDAETLVNSLKAGTGVLLEGKLEYQTWQNDRGERRSRVVLRVSHLEVLRESHAERLVVDRAGGCRLIESVNRAVISGNLTRNAVLRHTSSGTPVTSLSVAVGESWKDANGQWHDKTHFLEVVLWGSSAENAATLQKGAPVFVLGRLESNSWTDGAGQKRIKLQINAERLEMLERRNFAENTESAAPVKEVLVVPPAAAPSRIKRQASARAAA
ncbi:MAG: single-stranded DNA-binding protein [Deinococcales bacterium]